MVLFGPRRLLRQLVERGMKTFEPVALSPSGCRGYLNLLLMRLLPQAAGSHFIKARIVVNELHWHHWHGEALAA